MFADLRLFVFTADRFQTNAATEHAYLFHLELEFDARATQENDYRI